MNLSPLRTTAPATRARSVNPLVVTLTVGYLLGLAVVVWAVASLPDGTSAPPAVIAATAGNPTFEVNINAVLHVPTALPTAIPTAKPTRAATADITLNYCGTAAPGATCLQPPAPRPTQAPYPSCADAPPGAWCKWTGVGETTGEVKTK